MPFTKYDNRALSWREARSKLQDLLETYLDEDPPTVSPHTANLNSSVSSFLTRCIENDIDLYAGSLFLSIALLILASFSLAYKDEPNSLLRPRAHIRTYRSEVAGASLLVFGSITGLWMIRRRKFLCLNDSENSKRREVKKFLRAFKRNDQQQQDEIDTLDSTNPLNHLTSQTGVYPVYRRHSGNKASWSKIPSLLLVQGDWIALQIGDIAPTKCTIRIDNNRNVVIAAGEALTADLFFRGDETLPKGRTTLSDNRRHLLTLCNQMQIFTVVDTPLHSFLRKPSVAGRSSQLSRQLQDIRETWSILAIIVLVLTAVIAFSRRDAVSKDVTLLAHLPILAALGLLPVVGPAFLFFLEVFGTARILTTVHPFASTTADPVNDEMPNSSSLLFRYIVATSLSRLSLWTIYDSLNRFFHRITGRPPKVQSKLVRVPPASIGLLEKLGVATAFALVDDELACESQLIPQQLLVPSRKGLKLLDLCPAHDSDTDNESDSEGNHSTSRRPRGRSFDSDSESEDGVVQNFHSTLRNKILARRKRRRYGKATLMSGRANDSEEEEDSREIFDVQFEEPNWWQYLPSLKCIGVACLLIDDAYEDDKLPGEDKDQTRSDVNETELESASTALVNLVCNERRSKQLRSLAECIGFCTDQNSHGDKGDLSPFTERLRLHVLSNRLFRERLTLDAHERSSEMARWWGLIRPDSTSVVVQDHRTKAYQLLTVGDPSVVINFCNEAWQGEISTILPLGAADRQTIMATANNWKLADLDVAAFSYAPVPHTLETRLSAEPGAHLYLFDNADPSVSLAKDKNISEEWLFVKNQVFLGVLGSLVVPRREIQKLLDVLSSAGVRFVYFSPRNMRRQKELAMQMGIDVAWNCAISLRDLGENENDEHRMVSNYADWDVNAKLPHGIEDVRKHLEEVDNVPLLVSLFTDSTKETTNEMIEIFQQYNDTVVAVGLSHLTRNEGIFSRADVAVGIDILTESCMEASLSESSSSGCVLQSELEFVSSISAHSCAFRFRGASSVSSISTIIEKSRASLEAAVAAGAFLLNGCLSFSFYVLFSVCAPSTALPFVPTLGCVIFLQILLPCLGLSMAMTNADEDIMKRVPPKNDNKMSFGRKEATMFYSMVVLKALLPAVLPQLMHLIVFGELLIALEPEFIEEECLGASNWVDVVRCEGVKNYYGKVKTSSGALVFSLFVLCITVSSGGFVHRFASIMDQKPWENRTWLFTAMATLAIVALYATLMAEEGTAAILPWYFYLYSVTIPFLCLLGVEACKRPEMKQEKRAEKLRRLQFETRLGAWSPR